MAYRTPKERIFHSTTIGTVQQQKNGLSTY